MAYTELLLGPLIYLIVGAYYSNVKSQQSNISIVKLPQLSILWFVYTIIQIPNRIVWRYFMVSTITHRHISVVV